MFSAIGGVDRVEPLLKGIFRAFSMMLDACNAVKAKGEGFSASVNEPILSNFEALISFYLRCL